MPPLASAPAFGDLLRGYRLAAGLSQEQLAERARLSVRAISDLERGARTRPYRETVALLAQALDLSAPEREKLAASVARARLPHAQTAVAGPRSGPRAAPPLPLPPTPLIDRERELADVSALLAATRLLTLTGPGGVGKSRLALELARRLAGAYVDGVWLVELAPVGDPALVPATAATALGMREQPGKPVWQTLVYSLRPKRLLLVLDNCEHLLDACAALVGGLLRGCPDLTILVTSREALSVVGEVAWPVPPLEAPDPDDLPALDRLEGIPAVRLFVARAMAAAPRFALTADNSAAVAGICHQLDGIPLALELAAPLLRILSAERLATRLDERFRLLTGGSRDALPRQRTLLGLVAWSYDLLDERERRLFQRLSVFAGGWTLEAAEEVCAGTGLARDDVLAALVRLVEQSLVTAEAGTGAGDRYRLLETLRLYGQERLRTSGEADAFRQRHAAYYLTWAEQAAGTVSGAAPGAWLSRLDRERHNMRAALGWLLRAGQPALAIRLGLAWWPYLLSRGLHGESHAVTDDVLRLARLGAPPAVLADALEAAGLSAFFRGDYARARSLAEEHVALLRTLGDESALAYRLSQLGSARLEFGDLAGARAAQDEALAIHRAFGHRDGIALALLRLGEAQQEQGDFQAARASYEESLEIGRDGMEVHDPLWAAQLLHQFMWASRLPHHMGTLALEQGDIAEARRRFVSSLQVQQRHGVQWWLHGSLADFAALAAAEGRYWHALRLAGAVEGLCASTGATLQGTERRQLERWLGIARQALGPEAAVAAAAQGRALSLEEVLAQTLGSADQD